MDVHICADRPAAGFTGALALAMVLAVGANASAAAEQRDPALMTERLVCDICVTWAEVIRKLK